jgi:hypothetical protein
MEVVFTEVRMPRLNAIVEHDAGRLEIVAATRWL